MYGCKILQVPTVKDKKDGIASISAMKQVLLSVSNMFDAGSAVEIVFHHAKGRSVDMYFFAYGSFAGPACSLLARHLQNECYIVETMDNEACMNVKKAMGIITQAGVTVITKMETLVTSPYVVEGYYYYSDVLRSEGDKQPPENFNTIFSALLNSTPSFVTFQLKPTMLLPQEQYVFQNLTANLQHKVKAPPPTPHYGMIPLSEPYAQAAFNTYSYYTANAVQPVYTFNILVSSGDGQSSTIASTVMSAIESATSNNARLQAYDVSNAGQRVFTTLNPESVHLYIHQKCRNLQIWRNRLTRPKAIARLSTLVTVEEALLFFHYPNDDGQLRGVYGSTYVQSNETVSDEVVDIENIVFGRSVSDPSLQIGARLKDFTQHALIVGMPGSGKSTFCINTLLQFHKKGIPFLCIEPTKKEYRAMLDAIPDLQVFTPGNVNGVPFVLNPFLPPEGVPVKSYQSSLFSAFKAAIQMEAPLDSAIERAIASSYRKYGWRDYSKLGDDSCIPFGFSEFLAVYREEVQRMDYEPRFKGTLMSAGDIRMTSFLNMCSDVFDSVQAIPMRQLLSKPTVIELDAIGQEHKSLLMALLLTRISSYICSSKDVTTDDLPLKHVVLMDEAHVLLEENASLDAAFSAKPQNYAASLVNSFINTIRSYGTSIIIADQRPSAVGSSVLANTDLKISFRLTSKKERSLIADCAGMTAFDEEELPQLAKGEAIVYYSGLKRAQKVITPDVRAEKGIRINIPDSEVKAKCSSFWVTHKTLSKPYNLCTRCKLAECDHRLHEDARYYADMVWNQARPSIYDNKELFIRCVRLPKFIEKPLSQYSEEKRKSFITCTLIELLQIAKRQTGFQLNREQMQALFEKLELY